MSWSVRQCLCRLIKYVGTDKKKSLFGWCDNSHVKLNINEILFVMNCNASNMIKQVPQSRIEDQNQHIFINCSLNCSILFACMWLHWPSPLTFDYQNLMASFVQIETCTKLPSQTFLKNGIHLGWKWASALTYWNHSSKSWVEISQSRSQNWRWQPRGIPKKWWGKVSVDG